MLDLDRRREILLLIFIFTDIKNLWFKSYDLASIRRRLDEFKKELASTSSLFEMNNARYTSLLDDVEDGKK